MDGRRPREFRDGDQSREFAYVGNIVEGNVLAMAAEGSAAGW
jgi:nucleoside-diphosphate-sugar epimerase